MTRKQLTKKQLREVQRGEKEKAERRDVRPAASVRTILNPPDRLADAIAKLFGK